MSIAFLHLQKPVTAVILFLFLLYADPGYAGSCPAPSAIPPQSKKKPKPAVADLYRKAFRLFHNARREGKDPGEAIQMFRQCAEKGLAVAEAQLGLCFFFGDYVAQNKDSAVYWFSRAALQGESSAQCNLAQCYYYGEGTEKDLNQAFRWYLLAARQDDVQGMNNVAYMYERGIGTEPDSKKAHRYYKRAAEKGYSEAQYNLGRFYMEKDSPLNRKRGKEWWKKAAAQGNRKAIQALSEWKEAEK